MMSPDNMKDIPLDVLNAIALAVHRIVGNMPVAIKFRGCPGVLVDDGVILDGIQEGRELDLALARPGVTQVRLSTGRHAGKVMYASPIRSGDALDVIGVIGVIDTSGALTLKEMAECYTELNNQVAGGYNKLFDNINGLMKDGGRSKKGLA